MTVLMPTSAAGSDVGSLRSACVSAGQRTSLHLGTPWSAARLRRRAVPGARELLSQQVNWIEVRLRSVTTDPMTSSPARWLPPNRAGSLLGSAVAAPCSAPHIPHPAPAAPPANGNCAQRHENCNLLVTQIAPAMLQSMVVHVMPALQAVDMHMQYISSRDFPDNLQNHVSPAAQACLWHPPQAPTAC